MTVCEIITRLKTRLLFQMVVTEISFMKCIVWSNLDNSLSWDKTRPCAATLHLPLELLHYHLLKEKITQHLINKYLNLHKCESILIKILQTLP